MGDDEAGRRLEEEVADEQFQRDMRIGLIVPGTVGNVLSTVHRMLLIGGTIVAYEVRRRGVGELAAWIRDGRLMMINALSPTLLRRLLAEWRTGEVFGTVRLVAMTGEPARWEELVALRAHLPAEALVYVAYGTTETHQVAATIVGAEPAQTSGPVAAGWPMPGREVAILGEDGEPVAPGEEGEIVVTGADIGLGYLEADERGAFTTLPDGRRRFRTGDLGRLLPDGSIEHLGRLDGMVKIGANRVELGEVEAGLRALDGVTDAAVRTYLDDAGDVRLAAYVVVEHGLQVGGARLRSLLARRLPAPMLPDRIDRLDALPLLPNGKVDRRALPEPGGHRPADAPAPVAPRTPLEERLTAIFRRVLNLDTVSIHDDFFALGGDSLRAARVAGLIKDELGIEQAAGVLLEAPTVARLAEGIAADRAAWSRLVPAQTGGDGALVVAVYDGLAWLFQLRSMAERLGPGQPLYGIRFVAPEDGGSIASVAAHWVAEIRAVRPQGPYVVYGLFSGGVLAFEIARLLGDEVTLLAIQQTRAPARPPSPLPRRVLGEIRRRVRGRPRPVVKPPGPAPGPAPEMLDDEARRLLDLVARWRPPGRARAGQAVVITHELWRGAPDMGWSHWIDGPVRPLDAGEMAAGAITGGGAFGALLDVIRGT
jgi:acyl carrier protein